MRITVGDENDHTPHLESESWSVEVPENQSCVALYTLRATDPDGGENGRLEYRVAGEEHRDRESSVVSCLVIGSSCSPRLARSSWKHHLWQFPFHISSLLLQTICCYSFLSTP